jgi:transcriptional regulator with XRE-family HTH domain
MQLQGLTYQEIADEMAMRWGYRPRQAMRHAHGWTQEEVADRFNRVTDDPRAPMTAKRISDYEAWPAGGVKPTLKTLSILARLYSTQPMSLVDFSDRSAMTATERASVDTAEAAQVRTQQGTPERQPGIAAAFDIANHYSRYETSRRVTVLRLVQEARY